MCFLLVRFCSVSVRETELWLTCSVLFGQNKKNNASVGHYSVTFIFKQDWKALPCPIWQNWHRKYIGYSSNYHSEQHNWLQKWQLRAYSDRLSNIIANQKLTFFWITIKTIRQDNYWIVKVYPLLRSA